MRLVSRMRRAASWKARADSGLSACPPLAASSSCRSSSSTTPFIWSFRSCRRATSSVRSCDCSTGRFAYVAHHVALLALQLLHARDRLFRIAARTVRPRLLQRAAGVLEPALRVGGSGSGL